jgi:hypothetical protein
MGTTLVHPFALPYRRNLSNMSTSSFKNVRNRLRRLSFLIVSITPRICRSIASTIPVKIVPKIKLSFRVSGSMVISMLAGGLSGRGTPCCMTCKVPAYRSVKPNAETSHKFLRYVELSAPVPGLYLFQESIASTLSSLSSLVLRWDMEPTL